MVILLVNDAALHQPLQRFCHGNHEHEAWGFDHATSTANAAKDAEYPDGMCRTYADVVQQTVTQRGLHVHDFNEKSTAVTRNCRNVAEESGNWFQNFCGPKTVLVRNIPTVDNKKRLTQPMETSLPDANC